MINYNQKKKNILTCIYWVKYFEFFVFFYLKHNIPPPLVKHNIPPPLPKRNIPPPLRKNNIANDYVKIILHHNSKKIYKKINTYPYTICSK